MNKLVSTTIFILALININTAQGALITPSSNFSTPTIVTSTTSNISVDFGLPGSNIELQDLSLLLTFDQNLLDTSEWFTVYWLIDVLNPPEGITSPAWVTSSYSTLGPSLTEFSFSLNDMHIDENGIGLFRFGISGDGANISSLTLTGNAIITPVPVPPSLILFVSGLLGLFTHLKKSTNKRLWRQPLNK